MTRAVIAVEAIVVATTLFTVLGHAGWLGYRGRVRAPVLDDARRSLTTVLDAKNSGDLPLRVRRLHRREQADLLTGLAAALAGARLARLRGMADELGLLALAERRCRSRRWSRRLEGARMLTLFGGGTTCMLALLDDPREEVRAQAIEWAGGHSSMGTNERLLRLLDDPATLCRFAVKDSLLRLGDAIVPSLRRGLSERGGATMDLLQIATWAPHPSYLEPAMGIAGSPDDCERAAAVRLLGALGGAGAVGPVVTALNDPSPQVRAAAAAAIAQLGHWPAAVMLGERLRDPAWDVRKEAGLALTRLGAPGQLVIRRALHDDDPFAADMARLVLEVPVRQAS